MSQKKKPLRRLILGVEESGGESCKRKETGLQTATKKNQKDELGHSYTLLRCPMVRISQGRTGEGMKA